MRKNLAIAAAMVLAASSGPSFFGGSPAAYSYAPDAGFTRGPKKKRPGKNKSAMIKASQRKNRGKK